MPIKKRYKIKGIKGVFYILGTSDKGQPERIYYIQYRKNGKLIEEKAGRAGKDSMTDAKASYIRADRIRGKELSNNERRQQQKQKKWTIGALWDEYHASRPDLKPKSVYSDKKTFDKHIRALFGNREPREIQPSEVDRLRIELMKSLKPRTVESILEMIRRAANFGVKKRLCPGLSFIIEMPAVNNEKTEDMTPEQLKKFLEALDKEPDQASANIIRLALFTGMRRGELFKLEWRDIDFERGFISIRDPKGRKDEIIPLNAKAREVLTSHPRTENPLVFPTRRGRQRQEFRRGLVDRVKTAAGLPADFRILHGSRHSYASMLASSGQVDLYTLQKLLTHKDPRVTQRYAHLRDAALRRAAELAGSLVDEAMKEK
jgi:integrase